MSKPTLVTWPFVMLLLDYWPLGRLDLSTLHGLRSTLFRLVREKVPFFVLVGLLCLVTFVVQERGGALGPGKGLPLGARLGNALISYCRYLGKLFWPTNLAVSYPHPGHWPLDEVLLAGGLHPGRFGAGMGGSGGGIPICWWGGCGIAGRWCPRAR